MCFGKSNGKYRFVFDKLCVEINNKEVISGIPIKYMNGQGEWFSNIARKLLSSKRSSKKLSSTFNFQETFIDDRSLQNVIWLFPISYGKPVCVPRKCTQY